MIKPELAFSSHFYILTLYSFTMPNSTFFRHFLSNLAIESHTLLLSLKAIIKTDCAVLRVHKIQIIFLWTNTETFFDYSLLTFYTYRFQTIPCLIYSKDDISTGNNLPQILLFFQRQDVVSSTCPSDTPIIMQMDKRIIKIHLLTHMLVHHIKSAKMSPQILHTTAKWRNFMYHHTIKQPQRFLPTILMLSSTMRSCEKRLQIPRVWVSLEGKGTFTLLSFKGHMHKPQEQGQTKIHGQPRQANNLASL